MATTMNALSSPQINYAEFVRLTMPLETYTFCNAAGAITVDGITFTGLSSLLSIGSIQRDIKSTSHDLNVSLTGIDATNISLLLAADIKGSVIEIWRGFLDSNIQIETLSGQLQFFKRYQGIINNVSITEDYNIQARTRIATCSISCSSMRRILDNRISGVKTNVVSWQAFYPNEIGRAHV